MLTKLCGEPASIVPAGCKIVVHNMTVVDKEDRKSHSVNEIQPRSLRREWAFPGVGEDRKLPVGLEHCEFYCSQVAVALCAQLLIELVHRESVFCHVLLNDLTISYNDCRLSADYGTEADGFQIEEAQQHGETEKCNNRQQSVCERNAVILHGNGCKVGDNKGEYQLAGFKVTDLPFPEKAKTDHQNDI